MEMNRRVRDTLLGLQRAQLEREKRHKISERTVARQVVELHGYRKGWSEEDILLVLQTLGLDEEHDAR
jgi:hypothetical protein